jgi:hypothetical protein
VVISKQTKKTGERKLGKEEGQECKNKVVLVRNEFKHYAMKAYGGVDV